MATRVFDDGFGDLVEMYGVNAVTAVIDRYAGKKGFTSEFMGLWKTLALCEKNLILTQFDVFWTEMVGTCDHRLLARLEQHRDRFESTSC